MCATAHDGRTIASTDAVRAALEAMLRGVPLGADGDVCELHGDLQPATELTVTPQGQGPMASLVTEVEPGERGADRTRFGDPVLTFRLDLPSLPTGGAVVAHTVEIDGLGADEAGPELGPQISADFPAAMDALLAAAEGGARA